MALAEATVRVVLDVSRFERDLRDKVQRAANAAGRDFDRTLKSQMADTARTASRAFANSTRDGMLRAGRNASSAFDASFRQGIGQLAGRVSQRLGQGLRTSVSRAGLDAGRGFADNVAQALASSGRNVGRAFVDSLGQSLTTQTNRIGRTAARDLGNVMVDAVGPVARRAGREFAVSFDIGVGSARLGAPIITALASVVAAITSDLVPATGILASIPPLFVGIGAAAGTVAVSVMGLGDAFKALSDNDIEKLDEAMQRLAPAAQSVVREFAAVRPALGELQQEIQNVFFSQLQGQVTQVSQALTGRLRAGLLDVAEAAGVFGREVVSAFTSVDNLSNINDVLRGTGALFDELGPGVRNITNGILDFAAAAAPGLRSIGDALSTMLTNMGQWLSRSAESGQALVWVEQALTSFSELGSTLADIGRLLLTVVQALNPLSFALSGMFDIVSGLASAFEALPGPVQSLAVALLLITRTGLLDFFRNAGAQVTGFGNTLRREFTRIGTTYTAATRPLQEFVRQQQQLSASVSTLPQAGNTIQRALSSATVAFNRAGLASETFAQRLQTGPIRAYNLVTVAAQDMAAAVNRNSVQAYNRAGIAAQDFGDALRRGPVQASMELANTTQAVGWGIRNALTDGLARASVAASSFGDGLRNRLTVAFAQSLAAAERFSSTVATTLTGALNTTANGLARVGMTMQTGLVTGFNRVAIAASGAATAVAGTFGRAINGLVGTLGGPWGIAISAAVVVLGLMASSQQRAAQAAAEHKAQISELVNTLNQQTGAVTASTRQMVAQQIAQGQLGNTVRRLGVDLGLVTDAATGAAGAQSELATQLTASAMAAIRGTTNFENVKRAADLLGISMETLISATLGNAQAQEELRRASAGGTVTAEEWMAAVRGWVPEQSRLADEVSRTSTELGTQGQALRDAASAMSPAEQAAQRYQDALGILASTTADADAKARALNDALNILAGGTVSAEVAQGRFTELLQRLQEQLASSTEGLNGMGAAMLTQEGRINTQTQAGAFLINTYQQLTQGLSESAAATIEAGRANGTLDQSMITVAQQTQAARQAFIDTAMQMGLTRDQANQLANAYGLIPAQVLTTVTDQGTAQNTEFAVLGVYQRLKDLPPNTPVHVEGLTQDAINKLNEVGIKTETLPDGSVRVTAETQEAKNSLQGLISSFSGRVINFVARVIGGNAMGGIVPQAKGGIVGYANGGHHLRKMPANRAEIVKPNTWRVVGDRAVGDEAYIPITRSARSRSILDTTARRMGFELVPAGWGKRAAEASRTLNVSPGAIQVNAPYADAELVARATVNEMARYAAS